MKRILLLNKNNKNIIVERSFKAIYTQIKVLWVLLSFCMLSTALSQEWIIDPSPNPRTNNRLNAVVAISSTDAWAVGYYFNYAVTPDQTLALHWNGTTWSQVTTPNVSNNGYLNGIAAVSSNDVWAVGNYYPGTAGQTLITHWDGINWSVVASPNRVGYNELTAVTAISAENVWVVGYSSGNHATLVEHWDGIQRSIVPSPPVSFSFDYILTGVSAVSANDIWAVGYVDISSGTRSSLIEHWNGSEWSIVPGPNPGAYVTTLSAVTAVSTNDVWAAGWYSDDGGATYQTLIVHWDGSIWSVVPSPNPSYYQHLNGISAGSANDIWTVGHYSTAVFGELLTLIEHWNGTSWSIVSSFDPGAASNSLYAVAVLPSGEGWAVGRSYELFNDSQPWQTLVEHQHLVVPVELTSFTANTNGDDIIINWSTATETNNHGFEVERSVDGMTFFTVGFVEGNGTTTEQNDYSFADKNLPVGAYQYRLKQVDFDGSFRYSDIVEVEVNNMPVQFSLEQNYPNPFNPSTKINFVLKEKTNVNLKVFNSVGENVALILNEQKEAGFHTVEFKAEQLPSGVYFYKLQAGSFAETKKMIILK